MVRPLREPKAKRVSAMSLAAIIDAFLEWSQKNRSADNYEGYRYRLERFGRQYPDRWAKEQGYIDDSHVANLKIPAGENREVVIRQDEFDRLDVDLIRRCLCPSRLEFLEYLGPLW